MEREKTRREIKLNDLIKHVCARPKMYVGYENFRLVAAFIDGFAYSSDSLNDELREFNYWLALKFKLPRNWVWVSLLEEKYPSEQEILMKLPSLFDEFCNSEKDYSEDEYYQRIIIDRKN